MDNSEHFLLGGVTLPTESGPIEFIHLEHAGQQVVVALNRAYDSPPFVRIHSSCIFSEAFKTFDCDCARQLDASLKYISLHGGVVIYLYQEGRGVGLGDKIRAISIEQKEGLDTAAAFARLGHEADPRSYDAAIEVLHSLRIKRIKLATSNPKKITALHEAGIEVVDRIQLVVESNELIDRYLKRKQDFLGHYGKND